MKRLVGPFLILIGLIGTFFIWYREGTLPVNSQDKTPMIFVVEKGESVSAIARKLESQKLIRNRLAFYLLVKQLGSEKQIQAGDFRLYRTMSAQKLAEELTHGTLDVWLTVIEGMRVEEIAALLSKDLDIPSSVFIAKAGPYEGFLFPDTYLIPKGATSEQVITILRRNFDSKVNSSLRSQFKLRGLSLNGAVTLASVLEREAQSLVDKKMVAGILYNRLEIGMPLQVDATVQYLLGYSDQERTWWRKGLSNNDLETESEYNTYLNPGLPPNPIANPGLDSLTAVAYPTTNDFLYYLTDNSGVMHYAKTLDNHNRNIESYLN